MLAWLTVIGSLLACVIGLWKFFGRKAEERRQVIQAAKKQIEEGIEEHDNSKISAGFDRIRRI